MVDLLGMFRRRPAKRGPPGFARSRDDITALGDSIGDMLTSPVRDAPPIARDAPVPELELPPVLPRSPSSRPRPKSRVAPSPSPRQDQWRGRRAAAGEAAGLSGCA